MATINTSSIFRRFADISRGVMDEKNLIPAVLSGLTFGMFGYVAMRGKTIRAARDIVDDVVTGMAGAALKDITGGGMALGALAMFVPAYAEVGNMVADSVITISDGGSESDVVAEGDLMIAAGVIAIVTAIAYLFMAPQGDGPITSRLFGGE